jgi:mycothiol synthase
MLTVGDAAGVRALAGAASTVDGVGPLSEQTLLRVRAGGRPGRHLLARAGESVIGYAFLDPDQPDQPDEPPGAGDAGGWHGQAEAVVHPAHRRRGVGSALVGELVAAATLDTGRTGGRLGIWAHGDHPGAAALAGRWGFTRERVLWQLRRSLAPPGDNRPAAELPAAELPAAVLPAGVRLRTFTVGADEDAWLRVNAAAFAHHPEQGRWTRADLADRQAEPWFDPTGFFLAEHADPAGRAGRAGHADGTGHAEAGELIGFHWTKVHDTPGGPLGEVYVVGVRPDAAGGGLGRALTLAGLHHLRERGITQVMLYVDDDNTAAVRMYERLGFTRAVADVSYGRALGG